ncbi:nitrite reductase large subunit NirB [Dinghuibacter silviterrae]|uniref:Assimilatory nitrite reductase (NAD(P)H) large subunit n=1 Tax=Dinghuibacter silviterrae TaxID=1539049 RepID=A0A4R8DRZ2_9BACT|nr:nitrite reductase large subunit NirB [Dinghuibacter silviterrae]TDX01004.1 assimilatory nitrite reductase (NAD(P)H) large subunit precursor [Dinghuibacter silviterrae]
MAASALPIVAVIGNGMVGYKFCEKMVSRSAPFQLVVFGEETRVAYDRVHLSAYFDGKTADDLYMAPPGWYAENGVTLYTGDPIVTIDREKKILHSFKGLTQKYDYLVLATGSSAFVPNIPGVDKEGVFVYRTLEDLDMIKAYARKATKGAVLGGGLLGLEAAKALLDLGMEETHVVEFAPRLMPRQIDAGGSARLQHRLEALGLKVHLNKQTAGIKGEHRIEGLSYADGTALDVDMLVISAGIRPRDELARHAGLMIGPRGGILVDDRMKTSDQYIYAIGECVLHNDMIYGLVAPGYEMADVVASRLCGSPKRFSTFDMSTKLKLIGVDVASFGDPFAEGPNVKALTYEDTYTGVYKRINITKDGKQLLGGILVGDAEAYNILLQTTVNKIALPPNPEDLILGARGGAGGEGMNIMDLPDDAIICSCEGVTKSSICGAVREKGVTTIDAMKKCTKAGTGCGGCVPMVKDLLTGTMKAEGMYVKTTLCEHFDYSRQELLDLVRLNEVKTYDEVLDQFGRGDGCEVCKPAVASILASLWNDLILKEDTIQDSNDRFLANIQKGGTYSVVPRIPGGEITPEKLIAIGQVAQKYGLYTKITGGQRIDLFGAHLDDLPEIWSELIEAGFESGHAYGKALRTVKSCVGSTWCRFGLHDSVSFAIEIENRYKGLRAPHKLKGGVSGCIRECAEARGKDFGIIATEKGWNLYVCGNGGSKPAHAQLLAADVDKETCVRYLDRFLMFYIRTADPLTRTSTWLSKMDGGMAYLRNVVVNDSLGIGAELEEAMARHVATYQCEWKAAIEDVNMRKRFTHFVNAPGEKDPTVALVPLREQVRAKEW